MLDESVCLPPSIYIYIYPSGPILIHDAVYLPIYLYYQFIFYAFTKLLAQLFLLRYDAVSTGTYLPLLSMDLNSLTFEVNQSKKLFLDCVIKALQFSRWSITIYHLQRCQKLNTRDLFLVVSCVGLKLKIIIMGTGMASPEMV
jgi:hypothetical protein